VKFVVTRTSLHLHSGDIEGKPDECCFSDDFIRIDERAVSDPMRNKYIGPAWYKRGENHRVENGHIKRDFKEKNWFVEISKLEELLKFVEQKGAIVLQKCNSNKDIFEIEIYDDYRE